MHFTKNIFYFVFLVVAVAITSCNKNKGDEVSYLPVQFTEDGAWCFINDKGERVGTQEWEFMPTVTKGKIFTARTDSGLTVYKWNGDVANPLDSLRNLVSVGEYSEGLLPVTPPMQRIRIVDGDGETVFVLNPINGKEISSCASKFSEGLLVVTTTEGKSGVVNSKGEVIVEPIYSDISNFSEGYALAANYNYDKYDEGPSYFVLDREGKVIPVKGKFGYDEGDCFTLPEFLKGCVFVNGELDTTDYSMQQIRINANGSTKKEKGFYWINELGNGDFVMSHSEGEKSESVWTNKDGQVVMKAADLNCCGNYVYKNENEKLTVYNEEGQEMFTVDGNCYMFFGIGKFGPVISKHNSDYTEHEYLFYNTKGERLQMPKVYGVGTSTVLELNEDEIVCQSVVTSAYVDVTAAASKLATMAGGSINGKKYYYLGQKVQDILEGENARYFSGGDRTFTLPTDSTGRLASGDGFWVYGQGHADAKLVAPTYQRYFQVHHYDSWGRAWGWNRTRQTGVKFNPSAKVDRFDIQLHTNHPSGARLREAISRRMKKDGFTLVNAAPNYDEYTNGYRTVIVYGSNETKGVGALIGEKGTSNMSDYEKSSLAATIY